MGKGRRVEVGERIQQYQIVEHIGRGGMADVWSARDFRLNRMVAIKTIMRGFSGSSDPVALFRREAQTIARMEHPHILPIYDFGEHKGQMYIVMRYVTGGSLGDVIGGVTVPDAIRYATAVASALDYAHKNNVVHLDLKPQNILLDAYQSPYLADFGLATAVDPEGRVMNPGSGTLLYMAPEQITSEMIDYHADLYSYTILIYHMLMGRLPFDGAMPLALNQLQRAGELPELVQLPPNVTQILRRGTSLDVSDRPNSAMSIIREIQAALSDTVEVFTPAQSFDTLAELFIDPQLVEHTTPEVREAADLYQKATREWAGGKGRFLLGVTHYQYISDYYRHADRHGLVLDDAGRQMLLRGALEYDRDIDYWWDTLNDDSRRWVCLHAVRSQNPPTRVRAMYRLETLPDMNPPRIAQIVAQALQGENRRDARIAALKVLATRAQLANNSNYDIRTEYRGQMLSSLTRLEILLEQRGDWVEGVYTPEIDTLIAQIALDMSDPEVAEFAARTIGRIHSKTAVRYLAKQRREGAQGALRALAVVRDEARDLPDVVHPLIHAYAWVANTWRRAVDRPLTLIWRFLFAVIGGWIGMGFQVYTTFRTESVFSSPRIANTLAFGLIFGVFIGVVVLLADEIPSRLRGFWRFWTRAIFSFVLGTAAATLTWGAATWMYTELDPNWDLMLFGGFWLAIGFSYSSLLKLRGWLAAILTAGCIFIGVYVPFNNYCQAAAICTISPPFSVAPLGLAGLGLGILAGLIIGDRFMDRENFKFSFSSIPSNRVFIGAGMGFALGGLMWVFNLLLLKASGPELLWSSVVALIVFALLVSALLIFMMDSISRTAFIAVLLATFIAMLFAVNPNIVTVNTFERSQYGFAPSGMDALLYYDLNIDAFEQTGLIHYDKLFTSGGVLALFIALGGYAGSLVYDTLRLGVVARRFGLRASTRDIVVEPGTTGPVEALPENSMMTTEIKSRVRPSTTILDLHAGADEYMQTTYDYGSDPYATRPEEDYNLDEYVKTPRRGSDSDTKPLF
jgi:hypothetical protein